MFADLPDDIQETIMTFLYAHELNICMRVSKTWNEWANSHENWNQICQSFVRPYKIDLAKHTLIKYGESYHKWQKLYRCLVNAHIIRNTEEFSNWIPVHHSWTFVYPGAYRINEIGEDVCQSKLPPLNLIGLGVTPSDTIFIGGTSGWGVLNFDHDSYLGSYGSDDSNVSFEQGEKCLVSNILVTSKTRNPEALHTQNSHIICVGRSMCFKWCIFSGLDCEATIINIYGQRTFCSLENCHIIQGPKHGVYCGQGSVTRMTGCIIKSMQQSGIHVVSSGRVFLELNEISDCSSHGIFFNTHASGLVLRNHILQCKGESIARHERCFLNKTVFKFNREEQCLGNEVPVTTSSDNTNCLIQ